jgi:D-alanine-D-alanine ligase
MSYRIILIADIYPDNIKSSKHFYQEWESRDSINYLANVISSFAYIPEIIEPIKNRDKLLSDLFSIIKNREESKTILWNLVEGFYSPNREAYIPSLAEFLGIPFVGSDASAQILSLNKKLTLDIANSLGIPIPWHTICENKEKIPELKNENFPLFIKPVFEGSSLGISAISIIYNQSELINFIINFPEFLFPLILEEYLPGKEYTLGIMGQKDNLRALRLCEIITEGIYSEEVKSKNSLTEKIIPQDENIFPEIKNLTIMLSKKMGVSGYGRADWKMNKFGNPVFLEINLTPGLSPFYSSFPITYGEGKDSYSKMISEIIEISVLEYDNLSRRYGKTRG